MPYNAPRSLADNEVYVLTAYNILALNKLIGENDAMDAKTLPWVKMPKPGQFHLAVSGSDLGAVLVHQRLKVTVSPAVGRLNQTRT
jgi:hypothetical protein